MSGGGPPAPDRRRGWWMATLAAGVFPALLLGFAASALANRLAFVAWGIAGALAYGALHRRAWSASWTPDVHAAALLAVLAGAALVFGWLVARHAEPLDLGARALLPALYRSWWTRPVTSHGAAALLAMGAASPLLVRWALRRRDGR